MRTFVRLDVELEERLDLLAKKTGRTKASCLCDVIERGLVEVEDYCLAADALERVRKGEERTHSAAEARRLLGFND